MIAIVLATSFVSGTFVLTNTVQGSFDTMFAEIYGKTDIQVVPNTDRGGDRPASPWPSRASMSRWWRRSPPSPASLRSPPSVNSIVQMLDDEGTSRSARAPPSSR